MTYNLAQAMMLTDNPLEKFVIMNIIRHSPAMNYINFHDVTALTSTALRWRSLPSVAHRKINAGYTPSEGFHEQVQEAVYALGGEIRFDRVWDKVQQSFVVNPKQQQILMKTKALSFKFNDELINGDQAVDPDGPEGMKKRVTNMPSRQTVYFAASGGAALDPRSSVQAGRTFIDKMEQLHYSCHDKNVKMFLCNEGIYWGVGSVMRYIQAAGGNFLDVTRDVLGREIVTFKGAPLIDIGWKKDQTTEIITNTELDGAASSIATSIYAFSDDPIEGFGGIQLGPLEVWDPLNGGEQESTPTKLMRIEWWYGFMSFGSHGIVRGTNLESVPNWT